LFVVSDALEPKPKPTPKPEVQASPTTQLFAELAQRNKEGGGGLQSRPPIPNEFGKADYGVNKNVNFGANLRKTPTNVDGKPVTPKPTSEPRQYAYKSAAGKAAQNLPSLSWRVEGPEEVTVDDDVEFRLTCKNKETKASWDYNPRSLEAFIWPEGQRAVTTEACSSFSLFYFICLCRILVIGVIFIFSCFF
jgi:hypothetical protein